MCMNHLFTAASQAGQIAQWAKGLVCGHENLTSKPRTRSKSDMVAGACNPDTPRVSWKAETKAQEFSGQPARCTQDGQRDVVSHKAEDEDQPEVVLLTSTHAPRHVRHTQLCAHT